MADLKPISQFNAASAVDANTLFLVSTPNGANYDSENASAALVADAVVNDFEYTQDLQTAEKTITGGINENKAVIGYNYDAYDDTTTSANAYSVGDLVIYNNALYKCIATTYGAWDSTKWELTSIASEIGRIDTTLSVASLRSALILDNFCVYSAARILANANAQIPLTQNLFILFFKSYSNAACFGAYLISYHGSVATTNYISTLSAGSQYMPTLSIVDGNKLKIETTGTDIYYSMLRLN